MKKKRIYNNIYHPRKIAAKICDQCGHKYIPNRRSINRQRFCNEKCRKKFWNLSIEAITTIKKLIKENKKLKKELSQKG